MLLASDAKLRGLPGNIDELHPPATAGALLSKPTNPVLPLGAEHPLDGESLPRVLLLPAVCLPGAYRMDLSAASWFSASGRFILVFQGGEPGWDRTNDHLIKSQMLYR